MQLYNRRPVQSSELGTFVFRFGDFPEASRQQNTVFFKLLFNSLLTPFLQAYWHWHQCILLAVTV